MKSDPQKRVLMICLDSSDSECLLKYLPHLPHCEKLFSDGRLLNLDTTATDMDASVWPTFYMGMQPGKHGTYFPFQWDQAGMKYRRLNQLDWLDYRPFWDRLGERGIKVGVLDVMMVPLPVQPVPNVSHYFWQTQDEGSPDKYNRSRIWPEVRRVFDTSKLGYDVSADMTPGQLENLSQRLNESARTRGELVRWLLDKTDWQLFIASFSEVHRAGHYFLPDRENEGDLQGEDLLLSCYRETDRAIGQILEGIDPDETRVILFSLSGMGPNNSQSHFLAEVLNRFNRQFTSQLPAKEKKSSRPGFMARLRDKLPGPLQVEIARRVNQQIRDWVVNRAYTGGQNWNSTLAYPVLSGGQGYIRWNLAGRESEGILRVDSPEHRQYSSALIDELHSLTAVSNGRKIVKRVVDIPATYPGPLSCHLPDLSVIWEDMSPVMEIESPNLGTFKGRIGTGRRGNHRNQAFALTTMSETTGFEDPAHISELGLYVENLLLS